MARSANLAFDCESMARRQVARAVKLERVSQKSEQSRASACTDHSTIQSRTCTEHYVTTAAFDPVFFRLQGFNHRE